MWVRAKSDHIAFFKILLLIVVVVVVLRFYIGLSHVFALSCNSRANSGRNRSPIDPLD